VRPHGRGGRPTQPPPPGAPAAAGAGRAPGRCAPPAWHLVPAGWALSATPIGPVCAEAGARARCQRQPRRVVLHTGYGATRRGKNTKAWITGREAHQNAGTNAKEPLVQSRNHHDPQTRSHIHMQRKQDAHNPTPRNPSVVRPVPDGPRSCMWASGDPCPGFETPLHWKENVVPNGVSGAQKTR